MITIDVRGKNKLPQIAQKAGINTMVEALLNKAGIDQGAFTLMIGDKGHIEGREEPAIRVKEISGHAILLAVSGAEQEHRYKCFLSGGGIQPPRLLEALRKVCDSKSWFYYGPYREEQRQKTLNPNGQHRNGDTASHPKADWKLPPQDKVPETPPDPIEAAPSSPPPPPILQKGLLEDETNLGLFLTYMIDRSGNGIITSADILDVLQKDMEVRDVMIAAPTIRSLITKRYIFGMGDAEMGGPKRYHVLALAYQKAGRAVPPNVATYRDVALAKPAETAEEIASKLFVPSAVPPPAPPSVTKSFKDLAALGKLPSMPNENVMVDRMKQLCEKARVFEEAKAQSDQTNTLIAETEAAITRLSREVITKRTELENLRKKKSEFEKILTSPDYKGAQARYENAMKAILGA